MNPTIESNRVASRWPIWIGWGLNWFLAVAVAMGGVTDLIRLPMAVEGLKKAGFDERITIPMGVMTLIISALYAVPRTSVLGAILLTGYFGGAIATHVNQIGEPITDPVYFPMGMAFAFGVLVWLALYLRMPRLRSLAPIVK